MLTFGGTTHVTPPELIPEIARYTIFVGAGRTDRRDRAIVAILGHVGA